MDFSFDGELLAFGSEDTKIDVAVAETDELVCSIDSKYPIQSMAWHPSQYLLAYSTDDVHARKSDVVIYGLDRL
jgi:THO complex subunit 3